MRIDAQGADLLYYCLELHGQIVVVYLSPAMCLCLIRFELHLTRGRAEQSVHLASLAAV